MKTDYIVYGLLLVVVFIFIYTIYGFELNSRPNSLQEPTTAAAFKTISSGSTEIGSAQIDLTPKGIVNGQFLVDFAINTHSVDLSQFDLKKITTLQYNGKKILPYSATALAGHHNFGTIVFDIGEDIKSFKITIVGIPNVSERNFEWE